MNDKKTALLVLLMVLVVVTALGLLWYLAVEKMAFTDTIDPQPNLSEGANDGTAN